MEIIAIESTAFQTLISNIEKSRKITEDMFNQLKETKNDRYMDAKEVAVYTGFSTQWVKQRSSDIGAFQDGCGLRYLKSNVDAYMQKHSFKK